MQANLCGTSKSMIFMSPPYKDFETQTWKKVVDADVVEVRQVINIFSYVYAS